jgi:predicted DNA repair protein MutK
LVIVFVVVGVVVVAAVVGVVAVVVVVALKGFALCARRRFARRRRCPPGRPRLREAAAVTAATADGL